jgi:hypothetical protein
VKRDFVSDLKIKGLHLGGEQMRSELVFGAAANVSNRYLLTSVASKATRMLHRPHVRLEDTLNDVFSAFGYADPIAVVNRSPCQRFEVRAISNTMEAIIPPRPRF